MDRWRHHPKEMIAAIDSLRGSSVRWIFIDEVQKIPELLDLVQMEITKKKDFLFALSGSSARKIRRGAANLLAGRALENHLFPLTSTELGADFNLDFCLRWGSLPEIFSMDEPTRMAFLKTYVQTYVKEEIMVEQVIRNLRPFRSFLEIAAQSSGEIINYSKIARDINSDPVSVKSYFQILDDTLLGFYIDAFHLSVRKRQRQNPKFYLFDLGVRRALEGMVSISLEKRTSEYGKAFEHWVIQEFYRKNIYEGLDWKLSYLRTKDDAEIDLIIETPKKKYFLLEIKSTTRVTEYDVRSLQRFLPDFKNAVAICLSQDPDEKKYGDVLCLPWQAGIALLNKM